MKRETLIWTILMVAGGLFLAYRAATHGVGVGYVQQVDGNWTSANVSDDQGASHC